GITAGCRSRGCGSASTTSRATARSGPTRCRAGRRRRVARAADVVVGDPRRERQRRANGRRVAGNRADWWAGDRGAIRRKLENGGRVVVPARAVGLDDVHGGRVERDLIRLSVHDDRPHELLLAEVFRKLDGEDAPLTAEIEVRGLPLVWAAR